MNTLLSDFSEALQRHPDAVLFRRGDGEEFTFENIACKVVAAMAEFERAGVKPGDRIVCFSDKTIPLAVVILAAGLARCLPIALSPVFSRRYLRTVCRQSGARAVFTSPEFVRVAQKAASQLPILTMPTIFQPAQAEPETTAVRSSKVLNAREIIARLSKVSQLDDALLIQPTSGSTGVSKLVLRSHRAFSRYAQFVGDELVKSGLTTERFRILAVNALTHAFACHMLAVAMRFGAEIVIPTAIDISVSLDEVRALDPHVLPMTPRILRSLVRKQMPRGEPAGSPLFGPSARVLLSAGGRGDADTFQRLRREGVEVVEFYGSSEASIIGLTAYGGWRSGCVGKPVPDVSLKFSRRNEMFVRSPGVMLGYYGDKELTDLVVDDDGYYRTGDLGRLEEDGFLRVLGRRRDVYGTPEGSYIYPERLEILLESQDWIEQAMVCGDGKPYVTAHLVISPEIFEPLKGEPGRRWQEISSLEFPDLYSRVGDLIAMLNQGLELIEQIVAFTLYGSPFPETSYRIVTAGKVQRMRATFLEHFARNVNGLYEDLGQDSLRLVPPRERRYQQRVAGRFAKIQDSGESSVDSFQPSVLQLLRR